MHVGASRMCVFMLACVFTHDSNSLMSAIAEWIHVKNLYTGIVYSFVSELRDTIMKTFILVLYRWKGLGFAFLCNFLSVDKASGGECVRRVGFLQHAHTVCTDFPNGKVNMLVSGLIRELLGFHGLCDEIISKGF